MSGQASIAFHEVAASFNEEQWMRLENHQKDAYTNAIKEIHETLIAQGYTIVNPSIIFSIKKQDESYVRIDSHSMEKKSAIVGDFPDIFMKIKEEPVGETPINQAEHCVNQPSTSSGPASSCNIKQEDISSGAETKMSDSPPRKSNAVLIKTEEEGFSIDDYNSAGGEGTPGNSAGFPAVIKQEPDDGDEEETDNEDLENINGGNSGDKHTTVKTGPLSVEAKKRRIGPQVHGDILSLAEREARRLRVLHGKVNSCLQQSSFPSDPIRTTSDIKVESSDIKVELSDVLMVKVESSDVLTIKVESSDVNTDWCKCGHCCQLSSEEESFVCCHQISGMNYPLNDDCITLHPTFKELCLDQDRLDFLYRFLGRIKKRNDIPHYLHKLRCMSYRAFVVWAHGSLNKRDFKPVPACVVKVVQELLPYPEELNVGYAKIYDYPAAMMALDLI